MKFLHTIRFDASDDNVFERAAAADEWCIPGGFAFAHHAPDSITGKTRQAFSNGFLSLSSHGHSTFASVADITPQALAGLEDMLAGHLIDAYAAPSHEEAMAAARQEISFVTEMCRDVPINTVFTLRRFHDDDGAIREEFRTIAPPGEPAHAKVWTVVDDEAPSAGEGGG